VVRKDNHDLIFQTEAGKFKALARKVKELHEKGQPVLVGTVSVENNELLSAHFRAEGIPHEVLNAKNHEREGEIIAQAGRPGAVTIATNMAGRGVDIKLGGNPGTPEDAEKVKGAGGLFVLGTERHEARRIDNQLRGRAGRQGDPGETQFFVSLEDSLMRVFASDTIKRVMGTFGIPEDEPIFNGMITRSLEKAQTKIEEFNFDARKHVLSYDDVLNIQRKSVYEKRRALLIGGDAAFEAELSRIAEGNDTFAQALAAQRTALGASFSPLVRRFLLQNIDQLWVDHLEAMEYLRNSVNLRAYGQRDPLVEYKKEGLRLFQTMNQSYNLMPSVTREVIAERLYRSVSKQIHVPRCAREDVLDSTNKNDELIRANTKFSHVSASQISINQQRPRLHCSVIPLSTTYHPCSRTSTYVLNNPPLRLRKTLSNRHSN
jgi:preprotein translocase subunit SecA